MIAAADRLESKNDIVLTKDGLKMMLGNCKYIDCNGNIQIINQKNNENMFELTSEKCIGQSGSKWSKMNKVIK